MKEDRRADGHDRIMAAERSMRSMWDVNSPDEASFGTRCSSRTGECSNSVDTTFFSTSNGLSELMLLLISSRDGCCAEGGVAIVPSKCVRWKVQRVPV